MLQAIYKVPNGKLLKIFLEKSDNKIAEIKITGDFFIYPEEKITQLEAEIKGRVLDESALREVVEKFCVRESLELFGVDADSIAKTILMAANQQIS